MLKKPKIQNSKHKKTNTNKGITLIALVITIVVMLILVAVTISMAVNGGLFDYAGKASGDTNNAIKEEGQLANGGIEVDGVKYDSIDDYLAGKPSGPVKIKLSIAGTKVTTVPVPEGFRYKEGTIDTGYVIVNETDGNEFVWVPVDKNQKISLNIESEKEITGINLYDPYGDEIDLGITEGNLGTTYSKTNIEPTVNGMYMAVITTEDGITQETLTVRSLYAFDTENDYYTSDEYAKTLGFNTIEDYALAYIKVNYNMESIEAALQASGCPTIEVAFSVIRGSDGENNYQDLADYSESVNTNGGFYVARYEAGATTARTSGSSTATVEEIKTANGTPVSKEGYAPYNYITLEQAKGLAESMYATNNSYTVSLITHSAWNRTLGWINETGSKSMKEIIYDSTSWGNYKNAEFDITKGKYSENMGSSYSEVSGTYTKPAEKRVLLTTGATTRNSTNNIFDLAGNVGEWTLTIHQGYNGALHYTARGFGFWSEGCYDSTVMDLVLCSEGVFDYYYGFRPALYVK